MRKFYSNTFITIVLLVLVMSIFSGCETSPVQSTVVTTNSNLSEESNIIEEPSNILLPVNMLYMGDVMMDSYIADNINLFGIDYPWEDVSQITSEADISVVNLETSVSTRGETKKPKGFGFRSAPETLLGLKNSGIDLVSLANNHIMDFGNDALSDTLTSLSNYDIKYVGAGENLSQAEKLVTIESNGNTIGYLAYTSILPWKEWSATETSSGAAPLYPNNYDDILQTINIANDTVDILVIMLHWGTEYQNTPNEWQIELAHKMVDNGADLIIGHHPHILQGIEFYEETPILYSIGNFIFLKKDDEAGKTGAFEIIFENGSFKSGQIYPVYIKYTKANLLTPEDELGKEIISMLNDLSQPFGTTVDELGNFYKTND